MKALLITIAVIVALIPVALAIYYFVTARQKLGWFYFENKMKLKKYIKENKTAKHHQTVMIGDSIIDLYKTDIYYGGVAKKVYNRGISGDNTMNVLARLDSCALSIEPDTLILLIGTNDIHNGIDKDTTLANINGIIEKVKLAGVKNIYVESVYPVNANVDKEMVSVRTNEFINDLNEKIEEICNKKEVTYINIHDALVDEDGAFKREYTVDGLHPNDEGYGIVTKVLKENVPELN